MTTNARSQHSGTAAVLAVAVLLSAGWLAPAAGADPEFVGVLATAVDETVAKELKLTAGQREKLLKLIESREDSQELTELILASKDLAVAESKEKLARFRRESEALGLALLNPQQRAQLEQIRVRRLGLETLAEPQIAEDLILSQQQQSRVAQILNEREEQLKGADQNRIHVIRAETERKLAEVLTTQQVAAWRALSGTGGGRAPGPGPAEGGIAAPPDPSDIFGKEPPTVPDQAVQESPEEPPPEGTDKPPAEPAEGPPPEAAEAPAVTPGMLRFNFKAHPWAEVLEWFAEKANLSYVPDFAPQGTFNYIDPKEYTPAQAIDLLNRVLLFKGYTLVISERMLFLVNVEEEIPDGLVKRIRLEELDDRGESELVSVVFKLDKLTPDEAKQEIGELIGPYGKIVTLTRSQQIRVIETAGALRDIRDVIQRIEGPDGVSGKRLQTFTLKALTPEEALAVMRPLFDIDEDKLASEDGSIRLAIDPAGNRLLATGRPDKLDQVKAILEAVDVSETGEPGVGTVDEELQLVIYPITTADPESVLKVMQTLLEGEPDVRLATDPKTGSLVALALPSQHATLIRPTLEQYEGSARVMEVIHLRVVDPQLAVLSINKLFGAGGEKPNPNAPQVDADPISRLLLVRGTTSQIAEIRTLLEKMGETDTMQGSVAAGGRNVRMLQLNSRAARLALEQLQEFWPMMYGNQIKVVTPSAVIPGIRSRTPAGKLEPEEPKPDTTVPVPKRPRRGPPAGETLPAPNKAAGLSGGARVFFAAQTVEAEPQPADPEPQPDDPEPQPDEPAPQPDEPAAEPLEPAAEPLEPAAGPLEPAAEPLEPAAGPLEPAAEPLEPAAEPEDAQGPAAEEPQTSPSDEPQERAPIVVTVMPGGVMIASQDIEALDEFEQWLTKLVGPQAADVPYPTIFYLKYAKVALVAQTLDQILGGGTLAETGGSRGGSLAGDLASAALGDTAGGIIGAMLGGGGGTITPSGSVRITPETRLNALIVQANAADLDMIERILAILDQKESPEDILVTPKSRIIPLYYTQAERIAEMVKELYKENLSTGTSGGSGRPSPEQIMQMLRGGRGGSSRGGSRQGAAQEVQKMTISVDVLTNSVVVAAPEPLLTEVEQLVRSLDQKALDSTDQVIVTRMLHNTSPTVIQGALRVFMGDSVQFGGVGGTSRTRTSSSRTPTSTSRSSDDARRAMYMDMMRRRMEMGGSSSGRPSFGGSTGRGGPSSVQPGGGRGSTRGGGTSGMRGGGRGSTGGGRGGRGG